MTRTITEQMNSDMFDSVAKATYSIKEFSELELAQAKESFTYNGYRVFDCSGGILEVKK